MKNNNKANQTPNPETKTIVITEGGRKLYRIITESPLKGTQFQADSIEQVGAWVNENRVWYKENGWTLKTPAWESDPVRTAKLVWWRNAKDPSGICDNYNELEMHFWVEDLNPRKFKDWEDFTLEEKVETLKDILYAKAVITRDYKIQKEI